MDLNNIDYTDSGEMGLEKLTQLIGGPNDEASCHGKAVGWSSTYNNRRKGRLEKETSINKLVKEGDYDLKISVTFSASTTLSDGRIQGQEVSKI